MYTQCPECLSVFALDAPTLAQAHGFVTCGYCGADFDSLATLADDLPPDPFMEMAINDPALAPPRVETVVYHPQLPQPAVVEDSPEAGAATDGEDFSQLVFTPRFARSAPAKKRQRTHRHLRSAGAPSRIWALACGLLILLLGVQAAWDQRSALISAPTTGAWLRASCAALHCTLPLVAAPERLRLLDSNVQTHPSVPHALMISASVRNDAPFAQPYPVLTLILSNARGQRLAMRRMRPREYLDDTLALRRGLLPGTSTVLLLEVADPGDQAVAFEFAFE